MNKFFKLFHKHYHLKYHGVYRHARKLFIFDIALLVSSLLMLGSALFFFLWQPDLTEFIDLNLSLGSDRIRSGEDVTFRVDYTNRSKYKLLEPKLALHLPKGFTTDRTKTPESYFNKDSIIYLKDIEPGARGSAEVYGTLWIEPGVEDKLSAILSYRSEKNNAEEQKLVPLYLKLSESLLSATLDVPSSAYPNSELSTKLVVKNTSEDKAVPLVLKYDWPLPIQFLDNDKSFTLKPGEMKTLAGLVQSPNATGEMELKLKILVATPQGEVVQNNILKKIVVSRPNLYSKVEVNEQIKFANPGGIIPVKVTWKNNSQAALRSLQLVLKSEPAIVDAARTARENNLRIKNGNLVVDGNTRTALNSAEPNKEDSFNLNIYLKPSFGLYGSDVKSWSLQPSLEISNPETKQSFSAPGTSFSLPLATEVGLTATARYYTSEGDQLGRGPLPPVVGETTKYWIFVQFTNSSNPLENVEFRAELAPGVKYSGNQSVTIGKPLNVSGGSLSWSHPDIPAQTQTGLYFGVEVTPSEENLGQNLNLVRSITLTGTDAITGKNIKINKGVVTNVLPSNDSGASQGNIVSR